MTIMWVDARREEIREAAAEIGIDHGYISLLVDSFYEKVRAHPELGPIFDGVIRENWAPHLNRMKDFWASVALNEGAYSGKPVPAHQRLTNVTSSHFKIWLDLFRSTLEETAPSAQAAAFFMERAERIAQSLQLAMFGAPELAVKIRADGDDRGTAQLS